MPIISMFYGIIIYMYFVDNKQHHVPHIHIKYQEHEAVVSIPDGELLDGEIPKPKMKLLQAWIELHKDELVAVLTGSLLYQVSNRIRLIH